MLWRQLRAIVPFPGMVTMVVPAVLLLTVGAARWDRGWPGPARATAIALGVAALTVGLLLFVWTVVLFASRGRGTLAPYDAPDRLVVAGPYAHVRNPMYSGVFFVLVGEALVLRSVSVLVWFAVFAAVVAVVVPRLEERCLVERFGDDYAAYRAHVPRWVPRPTPWRADRAVDRPGGSASA